MFLFGYFSNTRSVLNIHLHNILILLKALMGKYVKGFCYRVWLTTVDTGFGKPDVTLHYGTIIIIKPQNNNDIKIKACIN